MISLGLLNSVLNLNTDIDKVEYIENNMVIYGSLSDSGWYDEINIYELMYKCKQWALKNGYVLESSSYDNQGFCQIKRITESRLISIAWCVEQYSTEQIAIFAACEWILKESK